MEKAKFDIPKKEDGKWGSYISKYPADSPRVPANALSINSRNVITSATGMAEKRSGGAIWNATSLLSGAALDQYEGVFSTGARLFIVNDAGTLKASTGNGVFNTITSGFVNPANFEFQTYQSRVYGCNGVDTPICMDINTSYGGVTYSFTTAKTKSMGAIAPTTAPTAGVPSAGGAIPDGAHTYKVTFVYYSGVEESNGGTASTVRTCGAGSNTIALTTIPVGGYGCTGRNIYRDNNDGAYKLLASINDNTTTTYTDTLLIGATPTTIPTTHNVPPVFKYISLYLDRLFVIDVTGKNIYWSTAGAPDVFDPLNTIAGPQDDVMTGIYVFNGIPYVFGQHTVGTILGTTDGSFYYNNISQTVGCVDNRSIQTRSIISVPTLLWLAATPNKGIYYTNGSIVQYLSDFIEDLTFNLAQISYLTRLNTQASQAAFQGGTASAGIDLLTNPGTIQTINPTVGYSHAADWLTGTLTNLVPMGDGLVVPTLFSPSLASGALGGSAAISGSTVTLNLVPNNTGESASDAGTQSMGQFTYAFAAPIVISRAGTLNTIQVNSSAVTINQRTFGAIDIQATIWADASGTPGSVVAFVDLGNPSSDTATFNTVLSPGTYWVGWQSSSAYSISIAPKESANFSGGAGANLQNGSWTSLAFNPVRLYTFTQSAVSASGTWTSPTHDTVCSTLTGSGLTLTMTGGYPASTSISVAVQGSANGSSWTTTDTLSSPTGTVSLTGGSYRYWQVVYSLASTDAALRAPTGTLPTLTYNTTGTWVSPAILCTADITTLDALTLGTLLPAGTTASAQVRTSTDGVSWSAYSVISSATPHAYAQFKVTMTTDSGDATSPTLSTTLLNWTVVSNLVSSAIDTGAVPAGWGIFQWDQVGTTGTVAFYFRSASTSIGLAGASFVAVTNGGFPTSSPLEFCQWKAVMTGTANNIPKVDSVTVNWLLSNGRNLRAASLFFNKSYYLAVANQGSTANDLLIEYDYEGNWRIHSGAPIGTMATYFNDAFYCDATNGNVLNAFKLATDNGTPIAFDLRTKAFGNDDNLTVVRGCRVRGLNTGTTIHVYYSVDLGATWVEMLNSSATLGYATTTDLSEFNEYFIPSFGGVNPTSGRTVLFRLYSNDTHACSILKLTPCVYLRKGKAIKEAMA